MSKNKRLKQYGKMTLVTLLLALGLPLGGCLVDNSDYTEAKQQRDQYRLELQNIHRDNDRMNQEIGRLYTVCDLLSSQVAVTASLAVHNNFTTGLGKIEAPTPAPATTTPRRVQPPTPSSRTVAAPPPRPQPATTRPQPATTRPQPATPQPQPPAAPLPSRPSGAIDWGF